MKQSRDNRQRAARIRRILREHYPDANGESHDVTDLLTDLRHYCDSEGLDFAALNKWAHPHYAAEAADNPKGGA